MRIRTAAFCGLILSAAAGAALAQPAAAPRAPAAPFTLNSTSFTDTGVLGDKYTAASANPVSPALNWSNAPAGTQSFTLVVHDLDTSQQKTTLDNTHWTIFNIPGTARSLPEGVPNTPTLPDGSIQIKASPTVVGFRGPAFRGTTYHHYAFELYALDTKLSLGPDATREDLYKAMDGHIIGRAAEVALAHNLPK